MFRLRCGWKLLCSTTSALSLSAFVLAGCATTTTLLRTEPAVMSAAEGPLVHVAQLSDEQAELVVAHAIAEHEMRRP